MKKDLLILFVILGLGLLLTQCKSNRFISQENQILPLAKAVYPLDTLELGGFLNFSTMDKFLIVFTRNLNPRLGEREALKMLKTKQAAVYCSPLSFDALIPHSKYISIDNAVKLEENITQLDTVVNGNQVWAVEGAFVIGITRSSHISGHISHSYEFRDDFDILVITPVLDEKNEK